jgi:hypothetical protein
MKWDTIVLIILGVIGTLFAVSGLLVTVINDWKKLFWYWKKK